MYNTTCCIIQIKSCAGVVCALNMDICISKCRIVNVGQAQVGKSLKKQTGDSYNWSVVEYLHLPLDVFDQTEKTLLSSVIYLPGTKNNCFWSYNSHVSYHGSSIMVQSWETKNPPEKRQSVICLWFDLFAFMCSSKPLKNLLSSTAYSVILQCNISIVMCPVDIGQQ